MTDLRADCSRCFALCCVVPAFARSADFAIDKPAGTPCVNLVDDFRCGIHARLRQSGFPGCTVYDCFGAGQHVAQGTFQGRDWKSHPEVTEAMFAVFPVMRDLHELLWYLDAALARNEARPIHDELAAARQDIEQFTELAPDALAALDVNAHRAEVNRLLIRASEAVRAAPGRELRGADLPRRDLTGADLQQVNPRGGDSPHANPPGADSRQANARGADLMGHDLTGTDLRHANLTNADLRHANLRGADLMGRDLTNADLRRANLRGAYLIGANLTNADLTGADVIGADLRGANLTKADLAKALYLTQFQVNAAHGDAATTLPATLTRPPHWAT